MTRTLLAVSLVLAVLVWPTRRVADAAPPAVADPRVRIVAAGDIARPEEPGVPQTRTAELIGVLDPDAVLPLGDTQYEKGQYANYLASYDPTWGAYLDRTFPTPGNHEYETPGAAGYFEYFGDRAHGPDGWYSFDLGAWHIVSVNSNCEVVDCVAERAWLVQDLAADTHLCQLAYYHHADLTTFWSDLAAAGTDVVLTGHRHSYERWARENGVRRFVVGTGGKSLGNVNEGALVGFARYGILRLGLRATDYTWRFITIHRRHPDEGTGVCA